MPLMNIPVVSLVSAQMVNYQIDLNTTAPEDILAIFLGIFIIPFLGFLYSRLTYRRQIQWEKKSAIFKLIDHLPDDLPPAFVCLFTGNLRTRDGVLATIYDLAKKDVIRLEHTIELGKSRVSVLAAANDVEQYQFEKVITRVPVSDIKEISHITEQGGLKTSGYLTLVEEEAIYQGFYFERPTRTQNRAVLTFVIPVWIVAIVYLAIWGIYFQHVVFGWLPGLSLFLSAFLPLFLGSSKLTEKGVIEATKWRSFYKYFKKALSKNKWSDQEISRWNDYLPYAQAFGFTKKWLQVAREYKISPPSWYTLNLMDNKSPSKSDIEYFYEMIDRL
jgi:hypothetical protein